MFNEMVYVEVDIVEVEEQLELVNGILSVMSPQSSQGRQALLSKKHQLEHILKIYELQQWASKSHLN